MSIKRFMFFEVSERSSPYRVSSNRFPDFTNFIIGPIGNLGIFTYLGCCQNFLRPTFTYTEDVGKRNNATLLFRYIYPCNSCHNYPCLCLNLGFFLLITYNLPFLRTILQSALLFFIDALTFM